MCVLISTAYSPRPHTCSWRHRKQAHLPATALPPRSRYAQAPRCGACTVYAPTNTTTKPHHVVSAPLLQCHPCAPAPSTSWLTCAARIALPCSPPTSFEVCYRFSARPRLRRAPYSLSIPSTPSTQP
ncbi:hypothetical protein BD779DRAFT_1555244 [Infundibulicybe gibba]|nr:hypothetical protein BD779DRAFT_1555244 [Infundibulicybe gibba]